MRFTDAQRAGWLDAHRQVSVTEPPGGTWRGHVTLPATGWPARQDNEEAGTVNEHTRALEVLVYGNSAAEIEADAIDQGRQFFGPGTDTLYVTYKAFPTTPGTERLGSGGKKYQATVTVTPEDA